MFMNHYREIYQRDPDSLKSIYEQFTGIVKKKVYKQLKRFSTEENFPQLLNNLDELLRERHDPNVTEAAW